MNQNLQTETELSIQQQLLVAQAVNRIASLLSKTKGLEQVLKSLMNEFIKIVKADEGAIQLLRPTSIMTRFTLIREGRKEHNLLDKQLDDFLTGWVIKQKKNLLEHDISALLGLKNFPQRYAGINSIVSAPISTGGQIIGAVNLIRSNDSGQFSLIDQKIVSSLAEQIGEFIASAELQKKLYQEYLRLQKNIEERFALNGIIGNSPALKNVFTILEQVIPTDVRVVILGESGTGKELIAKCIHYNGPRKDRPFVAVDCGALPANLLESELFGYVRGAFTGAIQDRIGLIEEADGGTLFLDEITNMSVETQAKLLRFIQENEIRPLGANSLKKVDVRIIVAASSDLAEQVSDGKMRSDLYYRLNVISVPIPSLRERIEDIPTLSDHFITHFAQKHKKSVTSISPEVLQMFELYPWPGNIRELENIIERAVVMTHFEETILLPNHLPQNFRDSDRKNPASTSINKNSLTYLLDKYERKVIENALDKYDWNQSAAAEALNISESVMRYKIKRLKLNRT
jgi:transcriptional regulator with GAF, ATPase, and Fis domain